MRGKEQTTLSEKIVLVDGHSILNRAFYGLPDLTNAEGLHTNAVYGFLNILFRILEEEKPQYLTVAFDLNAPTFRHKMFDAYKGTRSPMPQELREQVPLIKEVLTAMGVKIVSMEGYEADDLMGTLAGRGEAKGLDVTILSGDRDLLQLATEKVLIRIPKTKAGKTTIEDYHALDVLSEYQLTPPQIIQLKALMGDTADNIPGVPGIGIKTATKILLEYGTIHNAHEHIEEVMPNKARESLRENWDKALLSETLARIDTNAPVDFDFEEARLGNLYTPEAYEAFKRLGFRKLLDRFDDEAKGSTELLRVRTVTDLGEAEEIFSKVRKAKTAGLSVLSDFDGKTQTSKMAGIALSLSEEETWYFPVGGFFTDDFFRITLQTMAEKGTSFSVYGLKEILQAVELPTEPQPFDIKIAAYLFNPLTSEYPFDSIAREFIPNKILSSGEIFDEKKIPLFTEAAEDKAALLAGEIAFAANLCRPKMEEKLAETGMLQLFREIEMPLVYTLHNMQKAGIRVLPEELETYGKNLVEGIDSLEKSIYKQAGEEFNINSPKQLGVILFEKMKLPGGKKTKTGYSTSADVLQKLAPKVPFVNEVLEYRQLTKLKSTYADGLQNFISDDGRIHSTFRQTVTATGRISSTDPNLQNIPVRMELGRQIRKVFVPEEDCVFVDADYSQIELRVLASMSGDQTLIEAYKNAKDIHAITASQVFHVPFEEVTPLMRRNAKAVNFGIVYGISSFGLSQDLSITQKEAAEYIEKYYEAYPAIRSFLEGLVDKAKEKGYSETLYGRRRPMDELKSGNFMTRQFGERVAKNAPIQGTAADIIKIAMNRVDQRLREEKLKSRLLLQVHDELLIEAKKDELAIVEKILEEEMTGAADLAVKLEIDMHSGNNWYEAK